MKRINIKKLMEKFYWICGILKMITTKKYMILIKITSYTITGKLTGKTDKNKKDLLI